MDRIFRIGLLGASRIAPDAIIAPARNDARFAVAAVAARDPRRARAFATEHGIGVVAADYASLVRRPDIDIVYNALPPSGHAHWTIAALEAGKAVLCEKPFARSAAEARDMVAAAQSTGQVLIEAAHYRFHDVFRRAEAIVKDGTLGPPREAVATFDVPIPKATDELRWRSDLGGGALMDLGFYPLHALRTLIGGEPTVASARAVYDSGVDTAMEADLVFPGDVRARISCSMVATAPRARLSLTGTRGRLEIVNFIDFATRCRFTTECSGQTVIHPTHGPSTYARQLDHLHDVLTRKREALTGGADAIANMAAIDAIYRASIQKVKSA